MTVKRFGGDGAVNPAFYLFIPAFYPRHSRSFPLSTPAILILYPAIPAKAGIQTSAKTIAPRPPSGLRTTLIPHSYLVSLLIPHSHLISLLSTFPEKRLSIALFTFPTP